MQLLAPRLTINLWKNEREWRASRPKFFAALLLVGLVIALYQLFSSPTFFVDSVSFTGNRFIKASELNQVAGIGGWNIFFLDSSEIEARLLKMPELKSARISFGLPNRVDAEIVERQPRFVWQTKNSTFWVDEDAIAVRPRANLSGLMWLKDLDGAPVKPGQRVNSEAFNAAVTLHNAWKNGPTTFEWSQAHGLSVRDSHGWLIYFGHSGQMSDKLAALQVVTAQILKDQKKITFIDLGSGLPYYQETPAPVAANK